MTPGAARPKVDGGTLRCHRRNLLRFLGVLGCTAEDAEDLAQEALLRWLGAVDAPVEDAPAQRWLCTVARRLFIDRFRRGCRDAEAWSQQVEAALLERWQGERGDAWVDAAQDCVQLLPARMRRLVERFYREGASRSELAQELGMTENGVKTALQRVRAALRHCIEEKVR